jgi:hypothetical protein
LVARLVHLGPDGAGMPGPFRDSYRRFVSRETAALLAWATSCLRSLCSVVCGQRHERGVPREGFQGLGNSARPYVSPIAPPSEAASEIGAIVKGLATGGNGGIGAWPRRAAALRRCRPSGPSPAPAGEALQAQPARWWGPDGSSELEAMVGHMSASTRTRCLADFECRSTVSSFMAGYIVEAEQPRLVPNEPRPVSRETGTVLISEDDGDRILRLLVASSRGSQGGSRTFSRAVRTSAPSASLWRPTIARSTGMAPSFTFP